MKQLAACTLAALFLAFIWMMPHEPPPCSAGSVAHLFAGIACR